MFRSAVGAAELGDLVRVGPRVGDPSADVGRGLGLESAAAPPSHHVAPQLPSQFAAEAPQNSPLPAESSHASHDDGV